MSQNRYKSKEDLLNQINEILVRSKLIENRIDFDPMTNVELNQKVHEYTRILEFKFYHKGFRTMAVPLRQLYTALEKINKIEKNKLLDVKENIPKQIRNFTKS